MSNVIPLHQHRQAKAQGVFLAVEAAARRMGFNPTLSLRAAQKARERYERNEASPAGSVADAKAALRLEAPELIA